MMGSAPRRLLLVPAIAALALACSVASSGDGTGAMAGEPVDAAEDALPPSTAAPDTLPERLSRTLVGTIGERAVAVDLRLEEGRVSGQIRPVEPPTGQRYGGPGFTGTVEPGGSVSLEEHDGELVARIEGRLAMEGGRLVLEGERRPVLEGERRPADGDGIRTVRLEERGLSLGADARLVSRDVRVADSARAIVFYAESPRVIGQAGEDAGDPRLERLDAALRERIDRERAWFVESFGAAERDSMMERIARERGPSWYESSYDTWIAADSVLNVEATASTYGAGAAHPNHHTWTLVWDLAAGDELELGDLFRPASGWLDTLSQRAVATLQRELVDGSDDDWIRSGAGPEPDNFSAWTVVPDGLRIVFDPYQVAAYAAGPQVVIVPWGSLASVLDPDGPVATPRSVRLPSDASHTMERGG